MAVSGWQQDFGDTPLSDLVIRGLAQNLDVAAAPSRVKAAEAVPVAALLPSANLQISQRCHTVRGALAQGFVVVELKGAHFPKSVIQHEVFVCVRDAVSCRHPEEISAGGGVRVDHATLNRWLCNLPR